jgi:hypothetical protein
MLRLTIYSFLGLILGAFIAFIGIGILVSALPNASLIAVVVWIFAGSLACAIAGAFLARRMNKLDAAQSARPLPPVSNAYVAAYIYAISTLACLLIGSIGIGIFLLFPQPSQALILDFAANPNNIPFLVSGSVLLYALFSYVGIWYVARVKHLDTSHSSAKIAWWFVLVVLVPAVGDWQAFLTNAASNPLETITVIAIVGGLGVFVVKYFIRRFQERVAPSSSIGTQ